MSGRKLWHDSRLLFVRSFREGIRNPVFAFLFPTVFPLFMITLTSQLFKAMVLLPGFPIRPYAAYETPAVVLLGAMMGAGYSATALVVDAQSGFLDRLRLMPVRPGSILIGRLLFDVVRVLPAGVAVIALGVGLGTPLHRGLAGALAVLAVLALWALAYGGIFFAVALRTKNALAPLALLPLFMPLMFLSTAFVPRVLMPGWIRSVSRFNPYTYVIEGSRQFLTGHLSWPVVGEAVGAAAILLALTGIATARGFGALVTRQ